MTVRTMKTPPLQVFPPRARNVHATCSATTTALPTIRTTITFVKYFVTFLDNNAIKTAKFIQKIDYLTNIFCGLDFILGLKYTIGMLFL